MLEPIFELLDLIFYALFLVVFLYRKAFIEEEDRELICSFDLNIICAKVPEQAREELMSHR